MCASDVWSRTRSIGLNLAYIAIYCEIVLYEAVGPGRRLMKSVTFHSIVDSMLREQFDTSKNKSISLIFHAAYEGD